MSVIQLTHLIPVTTPLGEGYAVLFEGTEHDNYWTIALDNCAIVTFTQDKIRIASSYTHHRGISDARMKKVIESAKETE